MAKDQSSISFYPSSGPQFGPAPGQWEATRKWRNQVWEVWGDCSASDWGTCCLVSCVPCVAWGINMRRAFAFSMIAYAGLFTACIYGPQILVQLGLASCTPATVAVSANGQQVIGGGQQVMEGDPCYVAWNLIYMVHGPIALAFFVYAAYQRGQMRRKFAIAGSEIEDYLCWVVCGLCTLCQETRTLAHNDVEAGVWPEAGEKQPIYQAPKQAAAFGESQPLFSNHGAMAPVPGMMPAAPPPQAHNPAAGVPAGGMYGGGGQQPQGPPGAPGLPPGAAL